MDHSYKNNGRNHNAHYSTYKNGSPALMHLSFESQFCSTLFPTHGTNINNHEHNIDPWVNKNATHLKEKEIDLTMCSAH